MDKEMANLGPVIVNMHDAKSQLSKLVARAEAGEEVLIGRSGRPVARLVAYSAPTKPRRPGSMRGRIELADDFDETDPELLDAFEGVGPERADDAGATVR